MKNIPFEEITKAIAVFDPHAKAALHMGTSREQPSICVSGFFEATLNHYGNDPLELQCAALLAHFYNHGPELVEALKPLAAIAKDWESNGLDETRPDWGDTKEKILNLDLVCGRGGKTLLRMKDVFRAAEALAKASTVQMP